MTSPDGIRLKYEVVGGGLPLLLHLGAGCDADTVVMDGALSLEHMPFMRASAEALAAALPHARRLILEGQHHEVDTNVLAPILGLSSPRRVPRGRQRLRN